ncbi:hypothetical protein KR009_008943 [Drosophila setifemur]|nr:hypothetical protein KR009_008943 [Drosophila setifemur]
MFTLHLLLLWPVCVYGIQSLGQVCPNDHCRLSDEKEIYSNITAPEIKELHLNFCNHIEVLKLTPRLNTLVIHKCDRFKLEDLNPGIISLKLQEGNLTNLHDDQFLTMPNLEILELGENNISCIPAGTFRNLTHLWLLGLQGNAIGPLPEDVFQPITNLQHLDLSYNGITNLTQDIFSGNRKLQTLLLRGNPLTAVSLPHINTFKLIDLSNCIQLKGLKLVSSMDTLILENSGVESLIAEQPLRTLKASKCKLNTLILQDKSSIIELELQGNRLGGIVSELLCNMWNLQRLDLSNNSLDTLPILKPNCVLPSLTYLNVSGNHLTNWPEKSPLFGRHLTHLDISHNRLENISLKSLEGAANSLQTLQLEGNKMNSFDFIFLTDHFRNLKELALFENQFNESFFNEMVKYLARRNIYLGQRSEIKVEAHLPEECVEPKKPMHKWSFYDILIVVFILGIILYVRSKLYRREGDSCCFGFNCARGRTGDNPNVHVRFINSTESTQL